LSACSPHFSFHQTSAAEPEARQHAEGTPGRRLTEDTEIADLKRAIDEARENLAESVRRADAARWDILHVESEIAELYLRKETFAAQTVGHVNRRAELQEKRNGVAAEAQKIRARGHKLEEKIHASDLSANEIRHERNTLADRLREDYGIELSQLEHAPSDEEQRERETVQQEIDDLRQKLNGLGNVNLES